MVEETPRYASYYRYRIYQLGDKKPIAKFNSYYFAQRFFELLVEQEKNWERKNNYQLKYLDQTLISR